MRLPDRDVRVDAVRTSAGVRAAIGLLGGKRGVKYPGLSRGEVEALVKALNGWLDATEGES